VTAARRLGAFQAYVAGVPPLRGADFEEWYSTVAHLLAARPDDQTATLAAAQAAYAATDPHEDDSWSYVQEELLNSAAAIGKTRTLRRLAADNLSEAQTKVSAAVHAARDLYHLDRAMYDPVGNADRTMLIDAAVVQVHLALAALERLLPAEDAPTAAPAPWL
jgi:hypothetical protein